MIIMLPGVRTLNNRMVRFCTVLVIGLGGLVTLIDFVLVSALKTGMLLITVQCLRSCLICLTHLGSFLGDLVLLTVPWVGSWAWFRCSFRKP